MVKRKGTVVFGVRVPSTYELHCEGRVGFVDLTTEAVLSMAHDADFALESLAYLKPFARRRCRRHVSVKVYPGAMVASALADDAGVIPGLRSVPLGRWQSAREER